MMTPVRFENGDVEVDARTIGEGLGMAPELVQAGLKEGTITSLCERGIDDDAGSYRLSFFTQHRRLRMIVDGTGDLIRCSTVGSPDQPLPASYRKPGS
jgi:hypothetical protein